MIERKITIVAYQASWPANSFVSSNKELKPIDAQYKIVEGKVWLEPSEDGAGFQYLSNLLLRRNYNEIDPPPFVYLDMDDGYTLLLYKPWFENMTKVEDVPEESETPIPFRADLLTVMVLKEGTKVASFSEWAEGIKCREVESN